MQKRVSRDAYGFISCLTVIDLDGSILWQLGEPSDEADVLGKVSADVPLQVYDIDGDGKDEVIAGWDFEIRILDGATGAVKKSAKTPYSTEDDAEIIGIPYHIYAFEPAGLVVIPKELVFLVGDQEHFHSCFSSFSGGMLSLYMPSRRTVSRARGTIWSKEGMLPSTLSQSQSMRMISSGVMGSFPECRMTPF